MLPTAGNQAFYEAVIPCKSVYTTINVTGRAIAATKDNVGAFAQVLDTEVSGATRDMKKSLNRQLHGDGRDALAFCTTTNDTSPISIDDGRGNNFVYLQTGPTTCDIIATSDNVTKRSDSVAFTLTGSVSAGFSTTDAGTVTGAVDGDYYVLEDSLGYQLMGIAGVIDDGDPVVPAGGGTRTGLHGMAVASYPYWMAQVVEGASAGTNQALTLDRMQQPLDLIMTNSDYMDTDVEFMLCSPGVRRKYVELLVADRRHVNTMTLDGGFKGVDFNGIPLVVDPLCKRNRIYYVVPPSLKIMTLNDIDWMDRDGAVLKQKAGYDSYDAILFFYGDLATVARNANGLLDDISE